MCPYQDHHNRNRILRSEKWVSEPFYTDEDEIRTYLARSGDWKASNVQSIFFNIYLIVLTFKFQKISTRLKCFVLRKNVRRILIRGKGGRGKSWGKGSVPDTDKWNMFMHLAIGKCIILCLSCTLLVFDNETKTTDHKQQYILFTSHTCILIISESILYQSTSNHH